MTRSVSPFTLSGRVALVIGGATGIGEAVSRALATAGAVVAVNSRDPARVAEVVKGIPRSLSAPFDMTDHHAARDGIDRVVEQTGRLDIVVCSAALRDRRPYAEIDPQAYRHLLETNLIAPFELGRILATRIGNNGCGRLIYITSLGAQRPFRGDVAYASSKAGTESLIRSLAYELAPRGITTNGISPGFMLTDFNKQTLAMEPTVMELIKTRVPLGRWGKPEDVAHAAVFLASDAADYINGQIITVDGGLSSIL